MQHAPRNRPFAPSQTPGKEYDLDISGKPSQSGFLLMGVVPPLSDTHSAGVSAQTPGVA